MLMWSRHPQLRSRLSIDSPLVTSPARRDMPEPTPNTLCRVDMSAERMDTQKLHV